MSGKGNIWDEYREVYKEDNDEDSFLDVDPALINPDLTVAEMAAISMLNPKAEVARASQALGFTVTRSVTSHL